jgi:acyl-CoA thioester hydrolase
MNGTRMMTFELPVRVLDTDIDELGHASNIVFVRWIQEIAMAHSAAVGLTVEAYRAIGAVFFVRRQEIDYLRPVLRGDDLLLRTWIDSIFAAKCLRGTEFVRREADGSETMVARSMTTWGCVEIATGRPTRIPVAIREAFAAGAPLKTESPEA